MSDFIAGIYRDMELHEVLCRLPSELAVNELKSRIDDIDKLLVFFSTPDVDGAIKYKLVKEYIAELVSNTDVKVLSKMDDGIFSKITSCLSKDDRNALFERGKGDFSITFAFNLSNKSDLEQVLYVLELALASEDFKLSRVLSILTSVDKDCYLEVVDRILEDERPLVRSSVLCKSVCSKLLSESQNVAALKASAKIPLSEPGPPLISPLDLEIFGKLEPLERLMALNRHLSCFHKNRVEKPLVKKPTDDDWDRIIFNECSEFRDLAEEIVKKYKEMWRE